MANDQSITICTTSCDEITFSGGTCGDNVTNGDETCDNGDFNDGVTEVVVDGEVVVCTNQCELVEEIEISCDDLQ